jgi:hypothetical protein
VRDHPDADVDAARVVVQFDRVRQIAPLAGYPSVGEDLVVGVGLGGLVGGQGGVVTGAFEPVVLVPPGVHRLAICLGSFHRPGDILAGLLDSGEIQPSGEPGRVDLAQVHLVQLVVASVERVDLARFGGA